MNPIDLLISIPGPDFLWGFAAFAALCIGLGYFWPQHDDSTDYPMASPGDLEAVEIAYLRGGTDAVIQATCFESWAQGKLELVPCEKSLTMVKSREAPAKGGDQVEAALLRAAQSERNSQNLIRDRDLLDELDSCLEPVKAKLRQLHLLHRDAARRRADLPFWIALVILSILGGAKLLLGIARDKPVFFLVLLLAGTLCDSTGSVLNSEQESVQLADLAQAQSYLKIMTQYSRRAEKKTHLLAKPIDYPVKSVIIKLSASPLLRTGAHRHLWTAHPKPAAPRL